MAWRGPLDTARSTTTRYRTLRAARSAPSRVVAPERALSSASRNAANRGVSITDHWSSIVGMPSRDTVKPSDGPSRYGDPGSTAGSPRKATRNPPSLRPRIQLSLSTEPRRGRPQRPLPDAETTGRADRATEIRAIPAKPWRQPNPRRRTSATNAPSPSAAARQLP